MHSASFDPYRRRRGVSEVLGALLLIVVVIAAVASLSVFLSQSEKNAEERSALLTNVQNENLQISYAQFAPSNPGAQWELDLNGGVPKDNYYVQVLSSSEVLLTPMFAPGPATTATFAAGQNSLFIHKGVAASYSGGVIDFTGTGYTFNPARWSNITISVRNLNTEESGLYQIQVNDQWMGAWEQVTQTGAALSPAVLGAPDSAAIVIPARATYNFNLSVYSMNITRNESLKITLLTSAGNYFSSNYFEPTAVVKSSTSSENYQVVTRDVITFDGSQSYSSSSSIQSYLWQIEIPNSLSDCSDSAFSNPADLDVAYTTGETIQYLPESLFSTHLTTDCITGPIEATLTVVDDNGFTSTSQPVLLAPDPNIAPAASLTASPTSCTSSPCTVTMTVDDIFGNPVNGAVVTAIVTSGDVTITAPGPAGTTDSSGMVPFTVTWTTGGTIEFDTGSLPPVSVSFS